MKKIKLGRKKEHARLMLRNLATSLILYEKIKTSLAKAKAIKPKIERMINLGKTDDKSILRILNQFFLDKNASHKIIEEIAPKLKDKKSGFLRITRLSFRAGDGSPQVLIELLFPQTSKTEPEKEISVKTKISTLESPKDKKEEKKTWFDKVKEKTMPSKITKTFKDKITRRTTHK